MSLELVFACNHHAELDQVRPGSFPALLVGQRSSFFRVRRERRLRSICDYHGPSIYQAETLVCLTLIAEVNIPHRYSATKALRVNCHGNGSDPPAMTDGRVTP